MSMENATHLPGAFLPQTGWRYELKRVVSQRLHEAFLWYARAALGEAKPPRSFDRVCVVAALGKKNGIAKGAILQYESLKRIGIQAQLLDVTAALRNPIKRIPHKPATAYIFHSGGPQISTLLTSVLPQARNAYRIAYWAWELPVPPLDWPDPAGIVSEVWTCSSYARSSLEKGIRQVPVFVVPHAVPIPRPSAVRRSDRFQVLVLADSRSSLDRKNPGAAIAAFSAAFRHVDSARLIVKFNGKPSELEPWLGSPEDRRKIQIVDRFLDDKELEELFQASHVFLSLHRAEGFGLPMLEAMAAGTPVVASRWSGNLDFMNDQNSVLIDCAQTPLGRDKVYAAYGAASWAEPDVAQAAEALKRLSLNPEACHQYSQNGWKTAQALLASWHLPAAAPVAP